MLSKSYRGALHEITEVRDPLNQRRRNTLLNSAQDVLLLELSLELNSNLRNLVLGFGQPRVTRTTLE